MKSVPLTNVVVLPLGNGTVTAGVGLIALPVYVWADVLAIVALLKLYFAIVIVALLLFPFEGLGLELPSYVVNGNIYIDGS